MKNKSRKLLPKKLLSFLLVTLSVSMFVFFDLIPFTSKALESFTLTAEVDTTLNNGNGAINLDWSSYSKDNVIFKGYQSVDNGKNWQTISMMDYTTVKDIKVLNIYPTNNPYGDKIMPEITFTSSIDGQEYTLAKSASLKMWMEQATEEAPNGYGKGIIKVTPVGIDDFNANPNMIYDYDVAFLGSWDTNGEQNLNSDAVSVVSDYIDKGYGFVTGHDTIGWAWGNTGVSSLREKFKIKIGNWYGNPQEGYDYNATWSYFSSKVVIKKKGLFTTYPWDIGEIDTILTVPDSHTTSCSAGGDVWLEFTDGAYFDGEQPAELTELGYNDRYYLTTKKQL